MRLQENTARLQSLRDLRDIRARKIANPALDRTAEEFEAVFLSQMVEHMFAGIETDEMFGGGHAEDIYRSMLIDQYGKILARTGGIGIADHVKRELLTLQEVE